MKLVCQRERLSNDTLRVELGNLVSTRETHMFSSWTLIVAKGKKKEIKAIQHTTLYCK